MRTMVLGMLFGSITPPVRPYSLEWTAPAECPDARAVESRIEGHLQDTRVAGVVRARARVDAREGTWSLHLVVEVPGSEREIRTLEDTDCDGLADATALIVALSVAPGDVRGAPPRTADAKAMGAPEVVPTPRSGTTLATTQREAPSEPARATSGDPPAPTRMTSISAPARPRGHLRFEGGVGLGWLPVGGEVQATFGLAWERARLEVRGLWGIRRRVRLDRVPEAGADISGWAVGALACGVVVSRRAIAFHVCGGIDAGQVIGRPIGLERPQTVVRPWVDLAAMTPILFPIHSRVALTLVPELVVAVTHPAFTIAGVSEPIYQAAPVGGRFRGGIEVRLW